LEVLFVAGAAEMAARLSRLFPEQDERVIEAMAEVPREEFIDPGWRRMAYSERSLPIGHGQTISKPSTVLRMLSAMGPAFGGRLLEIGSGSGYLASVASRLFSRVYCVERVLGLVESSRLNLRSTGAPGVLVRFGDGSIGWPEYAPFDAILCSAGAPSLPAVLFEQLCDGGLLGLPVGTRSVQEFHVWRKGGSRPVPVTSFPCSFVPLIGREGFDG
jgi:protein-L-isoaspartate(D-aspartate) O-methyltransferase